MPSPREFIRPGIGRVTTDRYGRWYEFAGKRYWSVTTILGAKTNFGVMKWLPKYTAQFAVDNLVDLVDGVVDRRDKDGTFLWLKEAHSRYTEDRANIGTRIHDHAEAFVLHKPMPPIEGKTDEETAELREILMSFYDFLAAWRPDYLMVEAPVFHTVEQYAGTLDGIADFDRNLFDEAALKIILGDSFDEYMSSGRDWLRLLLDYKTGRAVYDDVALQLSPYRYAESVGLPDGTMDPMPEVDGAIVVHLRKDVMDVYPVSTDLKHYRSFLYIREVYRWQRDHRKGALGKPVELQNQQIALDT